jgi:hypothetical protein
MIMYSYVFVLLLLSFLCVSVLLILFFFFFYLFCFSFVSNEKGLAIFRTNQLVKEGDELCISYIGHDLLGEDIKVRQVALADQRKSFTLDDGGGGSGNGGLSRPCVGADAQNDLACMTPADRLDEISAIFSEQSDKLLNVDRKEVLYFALFSSLLSASIFDGYEVCFHNYLL